MIKSNRRLVWHYLRPLAFGLALSLLMAIALGVINAALGPLIGPSIEILSAPRFTLLPFDHLVGPALAPLLTQITGRTAMTAAELLAVTPEILLAVAFVSAVLGLVQWFMWERAGEVVARNLRDDLASAYLRLDPAARREEDARAKEGELSSAITTDVRLLREYLVHFYGGVPRELTKVIGSAIMLWLLSPKLTAVFLLGVVPAAVAVGRVGKVLRRRAAKALSDYSQLSEWLQQRLLGIETIKHYRTEALETAKMRALSDGLFHRFLRAARVRARTQPTLELLAIAAMVVVLVIALKDVASGAATGAVELSFLSTLGLLSQAAGKLGRYVNSNREGAAAVDRLRAQLDFLNARQLAQVAAPPRAATSDARIVCAGLTAIYPGAAGPALADFSFTFDSGRIYCLAGPSGAGKSTLFNILLGLVRPTKGEMRLEVPPGVEGTAICYMPQKVLLLPGTVAENVAYPDPVADSERVAEALARVGLTEAVSGLPGGASARVGDGGVGVSGGQAQRVLLARLWYHRKPVVLVDEGTSALDPEIERTVHGLLRDLSQRGAAVIAIAHRLAMAEAADVVVLLEAGRLAAAGAPREVMASRAFGRTLR